MKYSASFKLQVVKFASDNSNNSAASRKFGIDEKLVRDWRRKIDNIKSLPKTKCADRGRKSQWPELEKKVVEWVEWDGWTKAGLKFGSRRSGEHDREDLRTPKVYLFGTRSVPTSLIP